MTRTWGEWTITTPPAKTAKTSTSWWIDAERDNFTARAEHQQRAPAEAAPVTKVDDEEEDDVEE